MPLSSIETTLTFHTRGFLQRAFTKRQLQISSYLISLISCLCTGSILLFPLFTPVLLHSYSQYEVNVIGSLASIGMYFPLPVLGYLADCHGPVILSLISIVLFTPGYAVAAVIVAGNGAWSYVYLAACFSCIGCATSAMYFTALLTCAKMSIGSRGLAISAPIACYGVSSLIGSQLLKLDVLHLANGHLDLVKCFKLFSAVYLVTGIVNFLTSSVVSIERDILDEEEETPLIQHDLVPNHKKMYRDFLKNWSTYVLLGSLLLSMGPSEMYITSMGSIIGSVSPASSISDQVSVHAGFSTLARLSLGALSDVANRYGVPTKWLLLLVLCGTAATHLAVANSALISKESYPIISALNGFSYGSIFTLYPILVLSSWGPDIFGAVWGSFMVAPAVGTTCFLLLFARVWETSCGPASLASLGLNCLSPMFYIISASFAMSAGLLAALRISKRTH